MPVLPVSRNLIEEPKDWMWARWADKPVPFVQSVLGGTPDPWQCDVLDAIQEFDRVAIRSCHGVGKTTTLSWVIIHFLITRYLSLVPSTAPTFNKQVKQVLWREIHKWWGKVASRNPVLWSQFELLVTQLQARSNPAEWFATGFASSDPFKMEGYHAEHVLVVMDEGKAIKPATWDALQGMRTTQEAKMLVASTPGASIGEFYKVFTKYRHTWKTLFVIHPVWLKKELGRPEVKGQDPVTGQETTGVYAKGGHGVMTYYSDRVRQVWVEEQALDWGEDSPQFISRVIGDFPQVEGDMLLNPEWIAQAEDREEGIPGPVWVSCDVARGGRDRTVCLVGRGGTLLHGVTASRFPTESTAPEVRQILAQHPEEPGRAFDVDITAAICRRLRIEYEAEGIIVDDTGVGAGVTGVLRMWGERVVPVNFGWSPTDKPKDSEERARKERREMIDTHFSNIKAQMGWAVRGAFQRGEIAMAKLPDNLMNSLSDQARFMRQTLDATGRIRIVDPDDAEDTIDIAMTKEGKRSPDHFHALMLLWGATSGLVKGIKPKMGAPSVLASGIKRLGQPTARPAGQVPGRRSGIWLDRLYH